MNILYLVGRFPALSETFILSQITGLIDMGHKVSVLSLASGETDVVHEEVRKYDLLQNTEYAIPYPKSRILALLKGLFLLLRHGWSNPRLMMDGLNISKYGRYARGLRLFYIVPAARHFTDLDVVHCHFGGNGLVGAFLKENGLLSGKLVVTFHGADVSAGFNRNREPYRNLFRVADKILPISDYWRAKLMELGCEENKIRVHRMGIDYQEDGAVTEVNDAGNDRKKILLTVCRLVEKKGIEYAIRAVHGLTQSGVDDFTYHIIGDGPLKSDLDRLVQELGLQEKVIMHGKKPKSEVNNMLDRADIFLAPSVTGSDGDMEGIPVAIMEAMSKGIPVITTYHSGIPELVTDMESGLLVQEKDVTGLSTAISKLYADQPLRRRLGEGGRQKVSLAYNNIILNEQLSQLFQDLSGK